MGPRIRSIGKLGIKFALSGAALYIVFQNIDRSQLLVLLKSAQPAWLLLALLAYNASKILSSFRLTHYFQANQILLNERDNLQLYYIGMFYNLFLPGGIGGDAYKIWFLNRYRKGKPSKEESQCTQQSHSAQAVKKYRLKCLGNGSLPVAIQKPNLVGIPANTAGQE